MMEQDSHRTRTYREILRTEMEGGLAELDRPAAGLLASGLSAGLDIGFSILLMATVATMAADGLPAPVLELLMANLYSAGFIFVVFGRSELFTEHTTLAVIPVLAGEASVSTLGRLWGLVYLSNLVGAALFSALLVLVGPALGITDPEVFRTIAEHKIAHPGWVILMSALLAGWLMGLMSWLVSAGRDTIGQIFFVWLVAVSIGLGSLHHCIVGSVEVLVGVFSSGAIGAGDYAHFLGWTTAGNALGGVIFVAIMKYGHAIRGGPEPDDVKLDPEGGEDDVTSSRGR